MGRLADSKPQRITVPIGGTHAPDPTVLALAIAIGNAVTTLTADATFLLAHKALTTLRSLPVGQRMKAMGMEHRVIHDHEDGRTCFMCEDVWVEP